MTRSSGVAVLCAVLLSTGCTGNVSTETTPTETPQRLAPSSAEFEVYTHCGVENTLIDGLWFHAKPPLYNHRRNGPPPGWGDPYQAGTLTVFDDHAVFEALGERVVFVPAPDNEPVRICD